MQDLGARACLARRIVWLKPLAFQGLSSRAASERWGTTGTEAWEDGIFMYF
jgi:hypothetical protein